MNPSDSVEVITRHTSELTAVFGNDLQYFSNKFIALGFVSRSASDEIASKHGIGNREKGGQLLSLIITNCCIACDTKKWFDNFLAVFSSEAAYKDLATRMRNHIDPQSHSLPVALPQTELISSQSIAGERRKAGLIPYTVNKVRRIDNNGGGDCFGPKGKHEKETSYASKKGKGRAREIEPQCMSSSSLMTQVGHSSHDPRHLANPYHTLPQLPMHQYLPQLPTYFLPSYQPSTGHHHDQTHFYQPQSWPPTAKGTPLQSHLMVHPVPQSNGDLYNQFIGYVKMFYKNSEVERDTKVVKWPPTPSKVFINLACIDRKSEGIRTEYDAITDAMIRHGNVDVIEGRKCPITMDKIAKDLPAQSLEKLLLVEGAPGVGKSTFAWEFCRKWERGEIAQQYQLVLLLRLRDERINKAKSLQDLIYHPSEAVCQVVISELESTLGVNTLIILEGFDELPDACRKFPSVFLELIHGQLLPFATVMVTSRPWATAEIQSKCTHRIFQHVEVLGFTQQQIKSYISSALSNGEALDLEAYMEKHPQIRMCMYIPLNSAIVVRVYQESQATGCTLPTTLTELYSALTRTLLIRYLQDHPDYDPSVPIQDFNRLPPAVNTKFSELCKLAYRGIDGTNDSIQLIYNVLPHDFDSLGFMDSVTELYVSQGAVSSYNFLHLTFQEFLTAVHISNMAPTQQVEHFHRHGEGKLREVLRFLAGLTSARHLNQENFLEVLDDPPDYSEIHIDWALSHQVNWVYEAQRADLIYSVFGNEDIVEFRGEGSVDFSALGYCIAHSQCQWVLTLERKISEEDVRRLLAEIHTGAVTNNKIVGLRGSLREDFEKYKCLSIATEGLNMLFTEWKYGFCLYELALRLPVPCDRIAWPDLDALRALDLGISDKNNWRLNNLLPHLSLLSLAVTPRGDDSTLVFDDCMAIANLISGIDSLEKLSFGDPSAALYCADEEGMNMITTQLADNQTLPLEILEFCGVFSFNDDASVSLARYVTNTNTLRRLEMTGCDFIASGLIIFAKAVHHNSTLQIKALYDFICSVYCDNHVHDLAQLAEMGVSMEWSAIADCSIENISDIGAVSLAKIIHHIDNSYLRLSNNDIGDPGAVALAQALHSNPTLLVLYLDNNKIGNIGATALAQAMHMHHLKKLDLTGNDDIGKEGTCQLVTALAENRESTLVLPNQCREFVVQCAEYKSVKARISYR